MVSLALFCYFKEIFLKRLLSILLSIESKMDKRRHSVCELRKHCIFEPEKRKSIFRIWSGSFRNRCWSRIISEMSFPLGFLHSRTEIEKETEGTRLRASGQSNRETCGRRAYHWGDSPSGPSAPEVWPESLKMESRNELLRFELSSGETPVEDRFFAAF